MRRIPPPIDDQLIDFRFPLFKTETLGNGLTILGLENSGTKIPKVYFRLGIDFGEKNDPQFREGAAELLSCVLKKGTARRSYAEIVEEIDFTGGSLGIDSSQDFFYLSGSFLREYADVGLELISDVLLNPAFAPSEIEKERKKILADIENEKSSPPFLAQRRFRKVLYSPHPYSRSKSAQSIPEINREDLLETYRRYVHPAKVYFVATGDISFDETVEKGDKYFGKWKINPDPSGQENGVTSIKPDPINQRKVYLVDRPDSEQCNILLGTVLFSRNSSEFEAFQVMNKILGGGASGRLFMKLREEKGYTYGAYSSMVCLKDTGGWQATAQVGNDVTGAAIDAFLEEFTAIRSNFVSEEELRNAKRYLIGSFPVKNETSASSASLELQKQLHQLPENYWNDYLKMIDRISKNDVNAIAKKYLDVKDMPIVLVGDAKKIRKQVVKFGEMEMYDLDDQLIG